ncbi:hypothetical protein KM915_20835 [Cytobacillus oceanisediminis]|nr:hypothetical protein [Cytobacillus oceanisediminis]
MWILLAPVIRPSLENGYRNWRKKRHIKRLHELNEVTNVKEHKEKSKIYNHLDLLLSSMQKGEREVNVFNFVFLKVIIFLITGTIMYVSIGDLIFSLIVSIFFGLTPYIWLRFKLTSKRLNTSFQFLNEYHLIIQNYQSTGKDIYYTMLNVVKDIQSKELKESFIKLISALQKDRNENEFRKSINVFVFTVNSTFSKRFGKLLLKAHLDSADISQSLLDLSLDIKKRKQDMEQEKSQKLETIILGYAPIGLIPLFFYMAYKIAGVYDFWYMFKQDLPLTLFVIIIITSIISVLSAYILSKPRADI